MSGDLAPALSQQKIQQNIEKHSISFSTQKVAGRLVKLSELTFSVFISCFVAYFFIFRAMFRRLPVQFRYLLANLRHSLGANYMELAKLSQLSELTFEL